VNGMSRIRFALLLVLTLPFAADRRAPSHFSRPPYKSIPGNTKQTPDLRLLADLQLAATRPVLA